MTNDRSREIRETVWRDETAALRDADAAAYGIHYADDLDDRRRSYDADRAAERIAG